MTANDGSSTSPPPLPPGYPTELERTWVAADGTAVTLRPLRPDDLDRELEFIRGLSGETLRLRLQYSVTGVTREVAERLVVLDYRDTLAIGAFIAGEAGAVLIGVARYARNAGTDEAEFAIVVTDAWQGRGVGTELMRSLGRGAKANGIASLVGESVATNHRILDWARRFGFEARTTPDSGGILRVTIDLQSIAA